MFGTTMTFVLVAVLMSEFQDHPIVVTQIPVVNGAACEFARQSMITQLNTSGVRPIGLVCIATTARDAEEMNDAVNERARALERVRGSESWRDRLWDELPVSDVFSEEGLARPQGAETGAAPD